MNTRIIGVIIGVVVLVLLFRSCLYQERRATLHAIAINMPDCKESTVIVREDADGFIYTTKGGRTRCFGVEWRKDGKPEVWESESF